MKHEELVEAIAELEHEQWMNWSKTVWNRIVSGMISQHVEDVTGNRWKPNWIPYSQLPEEVKEFDRIEARKIVKLLLEKGWMRVKNVPATTNTINSQDH